MGNSNTNAIKSNEEKKNMLIRNYYTNFQLEKMKVRYLLLRHAITFHALDTCIVDYDKEGLTEQEIHSIKEKANTFIQYFKEFNIKQVDNFDALKRSYNI